MANFEGFAVQLITYSSNPNSTVFLYLQSRKEAGRTRYLVKWRDRTYEEATYEEERELPDGLQDWKKHVNAYWLRRYVYLCICSYSLIVIPFFIIMSYAVFLYCCSDCLKLRSQFNQVAWLTISRVIQAIFRPLANLQSVTFNHIIFNVPAD